MTDGASKIAIRKEAREYITSAAADGAKNIAKLVQDEFGVSRTTANRYISTAIKDGIIQRVSLGRYELVTKKTKLYYDIEGLEEHAVWLNDIKPLLVGLPENIETVLHYGCTEMINNCIDHSAGTVVVVNVNRSARETVINIFDDGVGIFKKIADALELDDQRQSVLELAKGKFTTDPTNHTGQGIFFTCRAVDRFVISSRGTQFSHSAGDDQDWVIGTDYGDVDPTANGTLVILSMSNDTTTNLDDIYEAFEGEDLAFTKTRVPVKLLEVGEDRLVSRSQAKRLLKRFDRFAEVVLDFNGVDSVGQAFADEVFRVFSLAHPGVKLIPIGQNESVSRMITRAMKHEDLK